jgi:glutamate-1-semialdehyde 2,1-aminomutase
MVTRFNDSQALQELFASHGDKIACLIVEPVIGAGGFIPASIEFMTLARKLTERYGALLISDEVIAGFRFRAGNAAALYGIQPDLTTMGKIVGGGMPVAMVAGRADVMTRAGREGGRYVRFDGGTYSAHPASMLAGKLMVEYLIEHESEIYPRLGEMGERMRARIEHVFAEQGVLARCTGHPNDAVQGSSLALIHFPVRPDIEIDSPDVASDPTCCNMEVREMVLKLALLMEDVFAVHGLGSLSTAHTEQDLERLYSACERAAHRIKPFLD